MLFRVIHKLLPRKSRTPQQAWSYKEWWNRAAGTIEQAYEATISASDENLYRSRGWHGEEDIVGAKQLIGKFSLNDKSRVLEIGCGLARIGREMAPHVAEWHGADIAPRMLEHARKRCAGVSNVFFHEIHSAENLKALGAPAFDFIYATIVLMHLDKEDLFEYLRTAFALLKTGGSAYFDTWDITHPDIFAMWRRHAVTGDAKPRGRIQCCAPAEFRVYIEESGYAITRFDTGGRLMRASCRKAGDAPPPVSNDGLPPFGYVGQPANESVVQGRLRVDGWCLDRVSEIQVIVDDQVIGTAALGRPWPGVAEMYPRYMPASTASGFEFECPVDSLPAGRHELKVVAIDDEQRSTCLTGQYRAFTIAKPSSRASAGTHGAL
ncbi:MAG: class I SAM-dependent methyltransferase [bacterium]|nr:class I SAM-dependent methyltransferase [Candidatus Sumerlaeota bacterium]